MKLSKLYINDFFCYDNAYIDFNQFSTALIVGKTENNSDISNGVGKTTIFKAIEYVLFGYSDSNLEHIIRDDTDKCSIIIDFVVKEQEYRVSRTRTKKGISDLTLYKKISDNYSDENIYHSIKNENYYPNFDKKDWADISGRRASDTEKELAKLIGVNLKSFRIFVHFLQRDFGGLAVATPENRKKMLKDALSLAVYSKLEKIAKDKHSVLLKEGERLKTLIDNLGNPEQLINELLQKQCSNDEKLLEADNLFLISEKELIDKNENIQKLNNDLSNLEGKFSALLIKQQALFTEKNKNEISVKEYTTKKSNILAAAKELNLELKSLNELKETLSKLDFVKIDYLNNEIISNKEKIAQLNLTIKNDSVRIEKLNKPMPEGAECEECRQTISEEHRKICQKNILKELKDKKNNIIEYKKEIALLNAQILSYQQNIIELTQSKKQLENTDIQIINKRIELDNKKSYYNEYSNLLEKFKIDLESKKQEIEQINIELKLSSLEEADLLKKKIKNEETIKLKLTEKIVSYKKEVAHYSGIKLITESSLKQKREDLQKKNDLSALLLETNKQLSIYPFVIQGFSSAGIPTLIIQNVLDDLQIEANNLLNQLKPGLQLSFSIEKTNNEGDEVDTLDICYTVNGKKRYYENISGAMQLAVNFSLKLGLSFFLQKMSGVDIKFLLLDEIDQPLDKASVDFFADIVKFFQKDYTILVITHNDNLKCKFQNMILVNQDANMVSKARVVSSW